MLIKIGNEWYAPTQGQPMMIVLTQQDKDNIAAMPADAKRYAVFPDDGGLSRDEKFAWMGDERGLVLSSRDPAPGEAKDK